METREKTRRGAIDKLLGALPGMSVGELCRRYRDLFGAEPRCRHRQLLVRQIAWKLQVDEEGDLPEDVKQYALAIARNCALRVRIGDNAARRRNGECLDREVTTRVVTNYDPRLPLPGSLLAKDFKGETYVVKVLDGALEFAGKRYTSLSAIAKEITGTKWNGFLFFGLTKENQVARKRAGNPEGD